MSAVDTKTRKRSKTVHEAFTRFFEMPTRETFRALLLEHVGELRECDFKESWPDNGPVARHLLGLANANGGCLVVGVRENEDKTLTPVGIPLIKDKADVFSGVKTFVPQPLLDALECGDFAFDAPEYGALVGKRFQVVFVHGRPELVPFVAQRDGAGVRGGAIYVRREGSTNEASYEEVQRLIEQRIAASPQTVQARNLKDHLEELKVLYAEIPRHVQRGLPHFRSISVSIARFIGDTSPNPDFPTEDYQQFLRRILDGKKRLIEDLMGLSK